MGNDSLPLNTHNWAKYVQKWPNPDSMLVEHSTQGAIKLNTCQNDQTLSRGCPNERTNTHTHTHIDLSWKWVNALLNQIPPSNNNYLCKAYIQSLWIFRPIHSVKLYRQSFHSGGEYVLAKAAKAIIYPEHVLASRMVDLVKEPSLKCHQPFDQSDSFVISSADILNFR